MTSVWFVSPAYRRPQISAIVYHQRATMLNALRNQGIDAHALIIADDDNLQLARDAGLQTLNHPNLPLGQKLNAGISHAYREGADHICFIGSDSLALPQNFTQLHPRKVTYGTWYTLIHAPTQTSRRQYRTETRTLPAQVTILHIPRPSWALNTYPRRILDITKGRPVTPHLNAGLDGSIRANTGRYQEQEHEVGPHQVVSLRSNDQQITSTDSLISRYRKRDGTLAELLEAGYDQHTVDMIASHYRLEP